KPRQSDTCQEQREHAEKADELGHQFLLLQRLFGLRTQRRHTGNWQLAVNLGDCLAHWTSEIQGVAFSAHLYHVVVSKLLLELEDGAVDGAGCLLFRAAEPGVANHTDDLEIILIRSLVERDMPAQRILVGKVILRKGLVNQSNLGRSQSVLEIDIASAEHRETERLCIVGTYKNVRNDHVFVRLRCIAAD